MLHLSWPEAYDAYGCSTLAPAFLALSSDLASIVCSMSNVGEEGQNIETVGKGGWANLLSVALRRYQPPLACPPIPRTPEKSPEARPLASILPQSSTDLSLIVIYCLLCPCDAFSFLQLPIPIVILNLSFSARHQTL